MTDYNPTNNKDLTEPTGTTRIELQHTQDECTKFMVIVTMSAIIASIIITYLLTRRSI